MPSCPPVSLARRLLPGAVVVAATMGCGSTPAPPSPASATPDELLAAAAAALGGATSYHAAGMVDPGLTIDLAVTTDGVAGSMTSHGVAWRVVVHEGNAWISGRALWDATVSPARAAAFGDSWVRVTDPSAAFGFARILPVMASGIPKLFGPQPQLAITGRTTVGGKDAIELRGPQDVFDIAAEGTPYPLRWVEHPADPGAQPRDLILDGFGTQAAITPPPAVAATLTPPP